MARIISEVLPRHVLVENSPALTIRGLGRVLGDLASLGYDAEWGVLGAVHAGAPHKRDRIWIVGHSRCDRWDTRRDDYPKHDWSVASSDVEYTRETSNTNKKHVYDSGFRASQIPQQQATAIQGVLSDSNRERFQEQHSSALPNKARQPSGRSTQKRREPWWSIEPGMGRVANGVAARVDRLKALGNGQVPAVERLAWNSLTAYTNDN